MAAEHGDPQALVGGPLSPRFNGRGEVYLARSWLGRIHDFLLRHDPDAAHHDWVSPTADARQRLVASRNRVELDVEVLLAAEPERESAMLDEALVELE